MKKLFTGTIAALIMGALLLSTAYVSTAKDATTELSSVPVFEEPLRVELEQQEIPLGYERVVIHVTSPEKAKALWLRATGSMQNYSLENANKLTYVARVGTVPCGCHLLDEFRLVYYGKVKDSPPDCRDECH